MKYTHLFFDLDHTLWDFDRNAEETLRELFITYELAKRGMNNADLFISTYTRHNHALWTAYHRGEIDKAELRASRFRNTFLELGLADELIPLDFEDEYLKICPNKKNLFPHTHEVLEYLSGRYELHLISNGFIEATTAKVKGCDLERYFKNIIISERIGVNKPDPAIFEYALNGACCLRENCVMIGDSLEADIQGAIGYGMDAIFFNPNNLEVPEYVDTHINSLLELKSLL